MKQKGIPITQLNGDKTIGKKEYIWFCDGILSNYGQDCLDKNKINYAKTKMLMDYCQIQQMTVSEFKEMVVSFFAEFKYKIWSMADVLHYWKRAEIYKEDWYQHQLKTTSLQPEDFECFIVAGEKHYCYKVDAHKVKITDKVRLYRPQRVERKVGQVANEEITETDKRISELFQQNLDLKEQNEQLQRRIKQLLTEK